MSIRYYAATATTDKARKVLTRMADEAALLDERIDAMPDWAVRAHNRAFSVTRPVDTRIPLLNKIWHDDLDIEWWETKKGRWMFRVEFLDGTVREYSGSPETNFINWDAFGVKADPEPEEPIDNERELMLTNFAYNEGDYDLYERMIERYARRFNVSPALFEDWVTEYRMTHR